MNKRIFLMLALTATTLLAVAQWALSWLKMSRIP